MIQDDDSKFGSECLAVWRILGWRTVYRSGWVWLWRAGRLYAAPDEGTGEISLARVQHIFPIIGGRTTLTDGQRLDVPAIEKILRSCKCGRKEACCDVCRGRRLSLHELTTSALS